MFAAGRPVWYLPLAGVLVVALLFMLVVGYDRYYFAHDQRLSPDTTFTFLSANTLIALKDDQRLHHALLGFTESIAHGSSELGRQYGFEAVEEFGVALGDSVAELRRRDDDGVQKRALFDDLGQAMGNVLGGLGVNTTGGLSAIVGNLGTALTEGLATPALFLGIGVGYVGFLSLMTILTSLVLVPLPG